MSDRLITAAGALGALLVVYLLFMQGQAEPPVTRPLSTEAGRNGYLGLRTWLEREGVTVVSLQERFTRLLEPGFGLPPSGNILITTMPHKTPLRLGETADIAGWTFNGNTVLLLAALNDTPEWSSVVDTTSFRRDLTFLTRMSFVPYREDDKQRAPGDPWVPAKSAVELESVGPHPLNMGVSTLRGFSDRASELWSVENGLSSGSVLRLGVESSTGIDAIWQLPRGNGGQVVFVSSGTVLTNDNIADSDARRLVANLVRHHLAPGGAVIFDDMHQGLSRLYDAAAFFRDPRFHATLLFLLLGWLVWVLGSSNRLAPPRPVTAEPRQSDFLAAAGGFMARRLDARTAGLLLLDEWFDEVRRARALPKRAEPPWDEIAATPALARSAYQQLRDYHERLTSGRAVSLVRLHNTLQHAREAIG